MRIDCFFFSFFSFTCSMAVSSVYALDARAEIESTRQEGVVLGVCCEAAQSVF